MDGIINEVVGLKRFINIDCGFIGVTQQLLLIKIFKAYLYKLQLTAGEGKRVKLSNPPLSLLFSRDTLPRSRDMLSRDKLPRSRDIILASSTDVLRGMDSVFSSLRDLQIKGNLNVFILKFHQINRKKFKHAVAFKNIKLYYCY